MNVIFLGTTSNFPHLFSANNTKTKYLAMGLRKMDTKVSVINNVVGCSSIAHKKEDTDKLYGINYIIYPRKGNIFVAIIKNVYYLFKDLKNKKQRKEKNILIIDTGRITLFFIYIIYGRLLDYKIVHLITEWPLAFQMNLIKKISNFIYVSIFGYLCDGILPISNNLIQKVTKFHKPILKTPILGNYESYFQPNFKNELFVFCANAGYFRIIEIVIEAFKLINKEYPNSKMFLILYGPHISIENIKNYLKKNNIDHKVTIYQDLSDKDLYSLYEQAEALLIPLDPQSEQDKYRFSQKIAEYIASGTPIITGSVGAINEYFENMENAYIAENYTGEAYYNCMKCVLQDKLKAQEIGQAGWILGKEKFCYEKFGEKLNQFLQSV